MKKKVNLCENSQSIAFNIRLNKQTLMMFSFLCQGKYGVKTVSKGFKLALNNLINSYSFEDIVYYFSLCDLSLYENDKKFSVNLSQTDVDNLEQLSAETGLDKSDVFRKVILFEISNYFFLVPKQNTVDFNVKKNTYGQTKFNFRVNRDILNLFLDVYSKQTGESNITSALNDMIKDVISDSRRNSKEIIIGLASQNTKDVKNDYKCNFNISNKRYSSFVSTCSSLGIKPHDCLRKKIMLYIQINE